MSAFAAVTIDINGRKAIDTLKRVNTQAQKLGKTFQRYDKVTKGITTRFNALGKAIATVGVVEFGRRSVQAAANFDKLNLRLRLLTEQTGTFAESQKIAADAQKLFGISTLEALEGVTNITARLAPLGVGVEDIRTTFIGFNTAAKLAGASSIEATNAFRQLAQALGSGRLQGDEFRSISEQIPTLLKPVADELGTTVGKLKEFSSQGKITSEVVIRALKKIEEEGAPALAALLESDPTQVFKNLQNSIEDLQITIGKALLPATKITTVALTGLAEAVDTLPAGFTSVVVGATALLTAFTILKPAVIAVNGTLKALLLTLAKFGIVITGPIAAAIGLLALGVTGIVGHYNELRKEQKKINEAMTEGTHAMRDNLIAQKEMELQEKIAQMNRARSKSGHMQKVAELKEEIKMLKRKNEIMTIGGIQYDSNMVPIKGQFDEQDKKDKADAKANEKAKNSIVQLERKIKLKTTEDEFDRAMLERQFQFQDAIEKALEIEDESLRLDKVRLINKDFQIDKQEILNNKLKEENKVFQDIANTIQDGIVSAIDGAIQGTRTLGEVAQSVLSSITSTLIQAGVNSLLGGIFPNIFGKKAKGGPVSSRTPYLVGERGPEIFTPSGSGMITPNHLMGGSSTNIVVNVDASGSSVEGDQDEGRQLGVVLSAAIQAELINQKRPGGLLA